MRWLFTSFDRLRPLHSARRGSPLERTAVGSVLLLSAMVVGCGSSEASPEDENGPGVAGQGNGVGGTDPGAGGTDPGAGGTDPGAGGTDPGAGGTEPGVGGMDPGAGGTEPGAGGTEPGNGGGPVGGFEQSIQGGGTQTGFFTFNLTIDGKNYNVQTNPWGNAVQTVTAGGDAIFRVDAMQEPAGGNPWDVVTFPSVYIGGAHAGANPTTGSGLPATVGSLTSVPTGLATNASAISYTGNTTYDVYFTRAENHTSGGPDVYLMVWFHANGLNPINGPDEEWDCGALPPTYVDSCTGAGSVVVGGSTFHRFIGPNGPAQVISYVPETRMDVWEFDLKDFIDDAVGEGVLTEAMYLQSIQAGFELVTGGAGLTVEGFYADVR